MSNQPSEIKLHACRKCKTMVKPNADKCTECGADHPAVSSSQTWTFLLIIGVIIFGVSKGCQMIAGNGLSAEDKQRRGFHCLSNLDGAHVEFMREVKSKLRDPKSFKHVETRITPKKDDGQHIIYMDYRAKNGFGGLNSSTAKGTVSNATCQHRLILIE